MNINGNIAGTSARYLINATKSTTLFHNRGQLAAVKNLLDNFFEHDYSYQQHNVEPLVQVLSGDTSGCCFNGTTESNDGITRTTQNELRDILRSHQYLWTESSNKTIDKLNYLYEKIKANLLLLNASEAPYSAAQVAKTQDVALIESNSENIMLKFNVLSQLSCEIILNMAKPEIQMEPPAQIILKPSSQPIATLTLPEIISERINKIKLYLSEATCLFFDNLLNIPSIERVQTSPTAKKLNCGDIDGSIGRLLLLGIQNGTFKVDDENSLRLLGDLLTQEAAVLSNNDPVALTNFQLSSDNAANVEQILSQVKVVFGLNQMIIIGDILYDRLSNNIPSMGRLVRELTAVGHLCILGNHDNHNEVLDETEFNEPQNLTFGTYARKKLTLLDQVKIEALFKNCYFDTSKQVFYIHAGIEPLGNYRYRTSFGVFTANTIENLVEQINKFRYEGKGGLSDSFTDFRLDTANMEPKLRDDPLFKNLIVGCGHNGKYSTEFEHIICMNSRLSQTFKPYACWL